MPTTTNQPPSTFLLIGLGNPGASYAHHRHNVGFMVIDAIREEYGFGKELQKHGGLLSEGVITGHKVLTFKPLSYMNLSGDPAQRVVSFFKIPLSHIIVFHDELDIEVGRVKIKTGGGAAGHNGLKSLDAAIGKEYQRIRIGIGHPGDRNAVSNYVLSGFSKDESATVDSVVQHIYKNIALLLDGDAAGFMNNFTLTR